MTIETQIHKGVYKKDIAEQLGVHLQTVSRALIRWGAPSPHKRRTRTSKLDPYKPMIDELLKEGVLNAVVIPRERHLPRM